MIPRKGLTIRRAAVLGAGIMGRGIAAHLAGCGVDVLLLDIVPPGEPSDDPAKRNAFAAAGLKAALKSKPALFYNNDDASRITVGNFDDDLDQVSEVDWIVEVVIERLDIKRALFARLDELRRPGCLISSNTSGLPLAELIEGRSDDFRQNFLITHFFNPVRYMKLLEVVSGPDTRDGLMPDFVTFARRQLGKGVVFAKDSPAFVANRIGTFSIMYTVHRMLEQGYAPEMVDTVFGRPMGRAKSAVFRTADIVGLDTLAAVTGHLHQALPDDEMNATFQLPAYFATLIERGALGSKTKAGCYKKVGREILVFDPYTLEYRERQKPRYSSVGKVKGEEDPGVRIRKLIAGDDDAAKLAWECTAQTLLYAARRLGEVADDLVQIDNGMKWGFGQELGPFETWDAIGVPESVARMKAEGLQIPAWIEEMLASGRTRFYEGGPGERTYWDAHGKAAASESVSPRFLHLPVSVWRGGRKDGGPHPALVERNGSSRLWDIGEGVLCVEFASKMNAVDDDIIKMLGAAVDRAEADFQAVILGNHAKDAFSAGANLMLVMMAAAQKAWDQISDMISAFQQVNLRLRHSRVPVVAAPFGLTLGGGAEMALGSDAIQAHAELYMGLVEVGVGLIPGGGGTFALLHNLATGAPDDADPISYLRAAFMTIGMAKVGVSAEMSRKLGFLRPHDRITMDRDELLEAAKQRALGMARSDYRPPKPRTLRVAGRTGYATLYSALWGMKEAHQISEHDMKIGAQLVRVLCGGDVPAGAVVAEGRFHELEREAFVSLCGEPKTQARIQHMLMNNKPLRN